MSRPFNELTNRGKALRLRRMALFALESYDLQVTQVRLITNEMNGIFRIDTAVGEKYVMRIALPAGGHPIAHLRSEMTWLAALARETQLSVPEPLPTRDGRLVIEVSHDGIPEPRLCMIFGWVPGSDLADHLDTNSVTKLGQLSAELHLHAATFSPPNDFEILRFDKVFPFPEPVLLFNARYHAVLPASHRLLFERAVAVAQQAIDRLMASGEPMRVIHGDLHPWNVRWARGLLSPIDFEDMMWGWPVQDIATSLYYFLANDQYHELRNAFQRGYTVIAPWPERNPGEIDVFIAARGVGLLNFLMQDYPPESFAEIRSYVNTIAERVSSLLD